MIYQILRSLDKTLQEIVYAEILGEGFIEESI